MRRPAISATLVGIALLLTTAARAELAQEGNLRVSFNGDIAPDALPRLKPAPVTVRLRSTIRTVDGSRPPQLRKVTIAVNRSGHVRLAGLPTCSSGELQQTSTAVALSLCRGALVGHGLFDAEVKFVSATPIPVNGKVLVFNSSIAGKPAMLLHIYNASPVRLAFVVPFTIARRHASYFGTVFTARIPRIASDRGYVTAMALTLRRTYVSGGKRRSVFSANCAAGPGFPGAVFTLAKASFSFEDGRRLVSALPRDCSVR